MKTALGFNAITSAALILATVFLIIMGILLVSSKCQVDEIPSSDRSASLQTASNHIQTAYILLFIAAGASLLLAVAYMGQNVWWCPSELIHGIFFLVIIALWLIGIIYAYMALNTLNNPKIEDKNGADSYIWASLLMAIITFVVIFLAIGERLGYNMASAAIRERLASAEEKIHTTYNTIVGSKSNIKSNINSNIGSNSRSSDVVKNIMPLGRPTTTEETTVTTSQPFLKTTQMKTTQQFPGNFF